jgi:hypothetical protein
MVQQLFLKAPTTLQEAIRVAYFPSVTSNRVAVTAEAAGSSPVVPAILFKHLQIGTFGIWVQLGCNRFGGFPCGQQMHRKNGRNQSRLGVSLRIRF